MDIGLLGGTGDIGEGLGVRLAKNTNHCINIGSRDKQRAKRAAKKYSKKLEEKNYEHCEIRGLKNSEAIKKSDVILLSLPFNVIAETLDSLRKHFSNQVIISPVVPMYKEDGVFGCRTTCAAKMVREHLPSSTSLVSAFHSVPAKKLSNLNKDLECDVVVCGDDKDAKEIVKDLIRDIDGLRPLEGGPLDVSTLCESLTPLLLNVAIRNELDDPAIKFVNNE